MKAKELVARTKKLELELDEIIEDFKRDHFEFDALEDLGKQAVYLASKLREEVNRCTPHRGNWTSFERDVFGQVVTLYSGHNIETIKFTKDDCEIGWRYSYDDEQEVTLVPLKWLDLRFDEVVEIIKARICDYLIEEQRKKKQEEEFREKKLLKALKEKYE